MRHGCGCSIAATVPASREDVHGAGNDQPTVTNATSAWALISHFAVAVSGIVSVGLNAVELVNDRYR